MGKIKVLYIDDELGNINAFKASFRRDFEIFTAVSAKEGLNVLSNNSIEVVLSDQRMPTTTGIDFFESILELHPNPIRILITAYADIEAVIDAINRGKVYRYIAKPWNDFDLKVTIENAYHLYSLKEQNNKLNAKYEKVFSHSSDPILLFDVKGRVTDFNKSAADFFNDGESLTLKTIHTIIKEKEDVKRVFRLLANEGVINGYECQFYGKNNEIKDCIFSLNKITNSYNEVISYQAIVKDVTEQNKLKQILIKKTVEIQELERARISRDLHDGLGQSLIGVKLYLESLKEQKLETAVKVLQETLRELRTICFNTLPLVLQEYGLVYGVEELKSSIKRLNFNLVFTHTVDFPRVVKPLEISIFRIIQEFVSNSVKHSKASEISVDLKCDEDLIFLNLKDNGVGFNIDNPENKRGNGLKNIKIRVDSFKGKIEMESVPSGGTEFAITFPM